MGRVEVLSEALVSLISAGEVVENPSSIVKELIENSLDAGADSIEIETKGGGVDYISVSDNGTGILRDDCEVVLHRYSTSKISKREDIDAIQTYGFRGEALASIAAVAEVKITTQSSEEEIGSRINSRYGEQPVVTDTARPPGTRVEVFNVFEMVPARRKHLGSARAENYQISEIVAKHAIARPDVGFRFLRDGEMLVDCPPNQEETERIAHIWGKEIAEALIPVNLQKDGIAVSGYVAKPPVSRGNRSRECFSVLKRPIHDTRLSEALESSFHSLLMKGRYPICVIDISLDRSNVDVNVHPTKREVRILDMDATLSVLRDAVRNSLIGKPQVSSDSSLDEFYGEDAIAVAPEVSALQTKDGGLERPPIDSVQVLEQTILDSGQIADAHSVVEFLSGTYRVIGQLHEMYILLESEEGLLLVDQHAAHERILYEEIRNDIEEDAIHVQELLEPIVLSLGTNEAEMVLGLKEVLYRIGYTVESFGGNEIAISSVPAVFETRTGAAELMSFVGRAIEVGHQVAKETLLDEIAKLTACHSAIRAGQSLTHEQMADIIVQLAKLPRKHNCCHGRPSMVRLKRDDIDRSVGRLGPDAIRRYRARHRVD